MTNPVNAELRTELGGEVPALTKLDSAQQMQLLELVRIARKRQHQAIKQAMEGTLKFIPALLRGPVRAFFKKQP